jgi:hypothetical protein
MATDAMFASDCANEPDLYVTASSSTLPRYDADLQAMTGFSSIGSFVA